MGLMQFLFKKQIDNIVRKSLPMSMPKALGMMQGLPVYGNFDSFANVEAYASSGDVYSIVRRIARTAAMIPIKVYKVVDDQALKVYDAAVHQKNYNTQTLLRKQFLKIKALEAVGSDNPLQALIDRPNNMYPYTEFYEGSYTFRLLTGNSYLRAPLLEFGVNAGKPVEMWLYPSQFMSLRVSDDFPRQILSYKLQIASAIDVPVEEMIHIRYFNPNFTYVGNELIGLSPLTAGGKILTKSNAETDYSVNAFQNSGISGLAGNESLRADEIETGALGKMKSDFYSEASGTANARKILFVAGKWYYVPIGLGPADMEVLESHKYTFKELCNLFGVSDRLFNNDASGSEISVDIAYKDLFTNAALPEVYALVDALNSFLTPKFNTKGEKYYIDCDITGISELQDDMKDMATVFSSLPVMNPKIIGDAFNWEVPDELNKFFVKQGYQTVEDAIAGAIQPLPIVTDNGN